MKPPDQLSKEERKFLKSQNRINKLQNKVSKNSDAETPKEITILCVRFGNKYGIDYVEKLRNMASRNIKMSYEFVCLTDDPTPISNVRLILQPNAGYSKGWWHKLHMFDHKLPLKGRILYFDLDVIICGNLDKLIRFSEDKFLGIRDFNRKFHAHWRSLNSSVMSWTHGKEKQVYEMFKENKNAALRLHGDQDWIWRNCKDRLDFFPDPWIQSYKWEIRNRDELTVTNGKRNFKSQNDNIRPSDECSVVVFHGDPNPSEVKDKFVVDNWC